MSTLDAIRQPAPGPASPLVLLVKEDEGSGLMMRRFVTWAGCRFDRVRSPEELWASPPERLLSTHGVIVDHYGDTLATLAEIRRRHPGVGTLVVSAFTPEAELGRTLTLPPHPADAVRAITELIAEFRPAQ
jgi:hypothetical protein